MKTTSLKTRIMIYFGVLILLWGVTSTLYAYFTIEKYLLERAQKEVINDLRMVRRVFDEELKKIQLGLEVADTAADLDRLKAALGLDYLARVEAGAQRGMPSSVVRSAVSQKQTQASLRVMAPEELRALGKEAERFRIDVRDTPKARPSDRQVLDSVLAMEAARAVFSADGTLAYVLYGGRIINGNFGLIRLLSESIFDPQDMPMTRFGTVTIFQDDVRVITTVLDQQGQPAIGTRISAEVYERVLEQGQRWVDRAYVVKDWYLTAYEPLKDLEGKIIGALYIGILERPYIDIRNRRLMFFWGILAAVSLAAVAVSYLLSSSISRPLRDILMTVQRVAAGNLNSEVKTGTAITELNILAEDFNVMADRLRERERTLAVSNEKLQVLNKDYLELIGFVSHELKGILSSVVLNTYLLSEGILGPLNEKQLKTARSMSRNLDYLAQTVKNFLSLSRIEKGELILNRNGIALKEQVFDVSIEALQQPAAEKKMTVVNQLPAGLKVNADLDLLQIVANNLVSNAIKYGTAGGTIVLSARPQDGAVVLEVYNDGHPIAEVDRERLFKKFSRLVYNGMEKIKGTGVGLFITKEIVEKHGGKIFWEPRPGGNSFIVQLPLG